MTSIKILFAIPLLLLLSTINAQLTSTKFSKKELNEDFSFLISSIEGTHPNPYTIISKAKFEKQVKKVKENFKDSLTLKEYYRLVSPLVASLQDGHTRLLFPGKKILNQDDYLFPFIVKSSIDKPYLKITEHIDSAYNKIPVGAEILSINKLSSKNIIHKIIENTSGESNSYRLKMGTDFSMFSILLSAYYDFNQNDFDIVYRYNGKTSRIKVDAITIPEMNEIFKKKANTQTKKEEVKDYDFHLKPEIKTAIITFNYMTDQKSFQEFLKDSFLKIKENNIENLIIDIRENGGGNSALGNDLLQYISPVPFSQYKETIIKYSQLQKDFYKLYCEKDSNNCNTYNYIKNKSNGTFDTISNISSTTPNPINNRFIGDIYLLTSTKTYSSAMNFAQTFKHYKIGEIIGEETGGWIVSYGDYIPTELPNTKLKLNISTKKFYTIGTTNKDLHGVIPDEKVPAKDALTNVLNKIKNKKS